MNDHSFRKRREGVIAQGWKPKYFALDPLLKERFERLCGALGLQQSQIVNKLISKWVEENEGEVRLDLYIPHGQVVIKQAGQVNIAVKAELTYVKVELSRILGVLETCSHESRLDFLKDLVKIILKASRIEGATQDRELGELLAKAETHLLRM